MVVPQLFLYGRTKLEKVAAMLQKESFVSSMIEARRESVEVRMRWEGEGRLSKVSQARSKIKVAHARCTATTLLLGGSEELK
jgi:hypothetical protein